MNNDTEAVKTFEESNGNYDNWNNVLYIGYHPNTFGCWGGHWFIDHINSKRNSPCNISILESYEPYYNHLKNSQVGKDRGVVPILGDALTHLEEIEKNKYDLVIWWHGPEHVEMDYLNKVFDLLEEKVKDTIMGGPLGEDPYQDPNSPDKHYILLDHELFQKRNYTTLEVPRHTGIPNISAWRFN